MGIRTREEAILTRTCYFILVFKLQSALLSLCNYSILRTFHLVFLTSFYISYFIFHIYMNIFHIYLTLGLVKTYSLWVLGEIFINLMGDWYAVFTFRDALKPSLFTLILKSCKIMMWYCIQDILIDILHQSFFLDSISFPCTYLCVCECVVSSIQFSHIRRSVKIPNSSITTKVSPDTLI